MRLTNKLIAASVAAILLALAASAAPANDTRKNWQIVKKAVREDASRTFARESRDVRYLKIWIASSRSRRESLRISLPLSLVEAVLRMASGTRVHFDECGDLDLDFREVLAELRKAGPRAILEISDHDGMIKIWLE